MSTAERRLVPGEPEAGGYRRLVAADGERHQVRDFRDEITGEGGTGAGTAADRNVVLPLDWPRTPGAKLPR